MKIIFKILQYFILIFLAIGLAYYNYSKLDVTVETINRNIQHCEKPIQYHLGDIDKRFNLSEEDVLSALNQAIAVWEKAINKKLFQLTADKGMGISLVYDHRQEATEKLKTLGLIISDDQAGYDLLKSNYDDFTKTYQRQKNEVNNLIKNYQQKRASYESKVYEVNGRGGAKPEEVELLDRELQSLNYISDTLEIKQAVLQQTVDNINALATSINKLSQELNLAVDNYNQVGDNISTESDGTFQEGLYIKDSQGERILIYQIEDERALVEVLTHELGHALGMDHVDNPEAIMYYLNESGSSSLTTDDIKELKEACQIK